MLMGAWHARPGGPAGRRRPRVDPPPGTASARAAREVAGAVGAGYCRGVSPQLEIRGEIRTAELVAALCLATDLGMAFRLSMGCTRR
jgi:hypothetical protein